MVFVSDNSGFGREKRLKIRIYMYYYSTHQVNSLSPTIGTLCQNPVYFTLHHF